MWRAVARTLLVQAYGNAGQADQNAALVGISQDTTDGITEVATYEDTANASAIVAKNASATPLAKVVLQNIYAESLAAESRKGHP